jgi:hypothetical protein
MLEITGASALPDVRYELSQFVAFDPAAALKDGEPYLLQPNTTTLVDVVLNRLQADRLLVIKDCTLTVVVETVVARAASPAAAQPTGRAQLIVPDKAP